LTLFEANLLLLYVMVLPNSSKLVAALYLGHMKSLWAYIEGMVGLSLPLNIQDTYWVYQWHLILHHSTSSFVQNLCDVALIFTLQLYFFTQNLQIYIVYIAILPHLREE